MSDVLEVARSFRLIMVVCNTIPLSMNSCTRSDSFTNTNDGTEINTLRFSGITLMRVLHLLLFSRLLSVSVVAWCWKCNIHISYNNIRKQISIQKFLRFLKGFMIAFFSTMCNCLLWRMFPILSSNNFFPPLPLC